MTFEYRCHNIECNEKLQSNDPIYVCPECGFFVCEKCWTRRFSLCPKCKETLVENTIPH